MKKLAVLLCLFMASTVLFAEMTKAEMQKMYLDYFKDQGVTAKIDSDGDIEFKWEGNNFNEMTFWIEVYENDQQFFRIMKPGLYSLETDKEKMQAAMASAVATYEAKVAKMYINSNGDNVTVSAEMFLASPDDFKAVFPKLMRSLDSMMWIFLENMK